MPISQILPTDLPFADRRRWRQAHPWFADGIYAFISTPDAIRKSTQDFAAMRARNVRRLYIGLETGDDSLRRFLQKPGSASDVVSAVQTIKAGGIAVGVIFMVGIGGAAFREHHFQATVELIQCLPLSTADIVYASPFVAQMDEMETSPYLQAMEATGYATLDASETQREEQRFKRALSPWAKSRGVRISHYDVSRIYLLTERAALSVRHVGHDRDRRNLEIRIMAFRTFNSQAEVAEYAQSLNDRWPQRAQIVAHISRQLDQLPAGAPHVLEFCCGAGLLAHQILMDHPSMHYTGIDISAPSIRFAAERLAESADRTSWLVGDLNRDDWQRQVRHAPQAIVTMQALHDLGDAQAVRALIRLRTTCWRPTAYTSSPTCWPIQSSKRERTRAG